MKKFYQVCYGKPNNNWKSFNYSADATSNVISFYEKNAINNTPQNFDYSKLSGSECLCEIVCQDGLIETSRIKYGMVDNFGRPMMFSHGYVFISDDKWLENPNNVLAMSEENFHFTVEETTEIPSIPKYNTPFSIESAKSITKLSDNQLKKIMGCVNLSLSSATNFPLYFVYEGNIEEKKALMYLIFSLLPFPLRYQVSISTANNFQFSMNKTFMIIDYIPENGQYFDVCSGETNIDLEVLDEEGKYPFLEALFTYGIDRYDEYCRALDKKAQEIGLSYICDYDDLVYADIILHADFNSIDKKNDVELTKFLLEFSSKVPIGNLLVDEFIYNLLKIYIDRNIEPNEVLLNRIKIRNDKTESVNLEKAYKHLQMISLVNSGEDRTIEFLTEEKNRNVKAFDEWITYILNSNGQEYIDKYYVLEISKAYSFLQVKEIWNERRNYIDNSKIDSSAKLQLHQIALNQMYERIHEKDSFNLIIEEYSGTYFEMFNGEDDGLSLQNNLFTSFWEKFNVVNFEFDNYYCQNLKEVVKIDNKVYAPDYVEYLLQLQETVEFVKKDNLPSERQMLEDTFKKISNYQELLGDVLEKMRHYIVDSFSNEQNKHLVFWYKLASINLPSNEEYKAFDNMINWNLEVFLSDYAFEESLNSPRISEYIDKWIYIIEGTKYQPGYLDQYDSKDDHYRLVKSRLSSLKAKEKQLRKEQKKADKNSNNDSDNSTIKKAFSLFKRK